MSEIMSSTQAKVWIVGAGPGAIDLITVRGREILSRADLIMYAGSLVDKQILDYASAACRCIDTSRLTLEEQQALYKEARFKCKTIARLHSGDPSIYGAIAEQIRILEELGMEFEIVPGVSSFTAAAATALCELTIPNVSQTVILTRYSGRASAVPERESLDRLAGHGATLCIFLSGSYLSELFNILLEHYPADTPLLMVQKVTWGDERLYKGTLERVLKEIEPSQWRLTTMIIVGAVLDQSVNERSRLYSPDFAHRFRKARNLSSSGAPDRGDS